MGSTLEPSSAGPPSMRPFEAWASRLFFGCTAVLWVVTIVMIFVHGYFGYHFSELAVFKIDDGWCSLPTSGIGTHCFGDFGYPIQASLDGYSPFDLVAVEPPFSLHIYRFLRLMPYNWALGTFLALGLAGILYPLVDTFRKTKTAHEIFPLAFLFLTSIGVIAAFDRGNRVLLLLPIIYFAVKAWIADRGRFLMVLIVAAGMLKWWGLALVILLLVDGKWLRSLFVTLGTFALHAAFIVVIPASTFSEKVRDLWNDLSNDAYAEQVSRYSVSVSAFVGRLFCSVSSECANPRAALPLQPEIIHVLLSVLLTLIWIGSCRVRGRHDPTVVVLFCALIVLVIPESAIYNNVVISAALLLVWSALSPSEDAQRLGPGGVLSRTMHWMSTVLLMVALATSIVPLPWLSPVASGFPIGPMLGTSNLSLLVPGVWIGRFALEGVLLISLRIGVTGSTCEPHQP